MCAKKRVEFLSYVKKSLICGSMLDEEEVFLEPQGIKNVIERAPEAKKCEVHPT